MMPELVKRTTRTFFNVSGFVEIENLDTNMHGPKTPERSEGSDGNA